MPGISAPGMITLGDVKSMTQLGESPGRSRAMRETLVAHDFGNSATVHHLNYFTHRETIDAIRGVFGF